MAGLRVLSGLLRAVLFVPVFLVAFVIMLPSLLAGRVPAHMWPATVLYALLH